MKLRSCLGVALFLCASAGGNAQTTTGRLIGVTVDESGAVLPGVTLSIESTALIGGIQVKPSDARGEFVFLRLAPGDYVVRASLPGFVTQERRSVKVPLGGAAALHIVMPTGSFSGEIEVSDETPVIDPTQVNTGQVFQEDYMQSSAIGSGRREYNSVVLQTAGVAGGQWSDQSQLRVFGSHIGENSFVIDGLDVTDPAMYTTTTSMNFDAIAEIQFQTGGFEAEFGRATGGILNLVTKSGGNKFSGTFDLRYRNDAFQESGEHFDTSELSTSYRNAAATLGGPILRDRVWFFASYQWVNDRFTPISSPTTKDSVVEDYLAKVTWQVHPGWRLTGRYSSNPKDIENFNASRWVMPEAASVARGETMVGAAELSGVLSDELLWDTNVGRYRYDSNVYPLSGDLAAIGHYNYTTGLNTVSYGNQQYWTSTRDEITTDLTWFADGRAGSHEVKGGVELSRLGAAISYCSTGTPNGERCVPGGVGYYFNDIVAGGQTLPLVMWENHTAGRTEYEGGLSSGFIQDAWRPTRNVTLKLGLRYDAVSYKTDDGSEVADFGMMQPRLGVAWDLTGDAKNVLRGSWGRYMHPGALTLPWHLRASDEPTYQWYSCSGVLPIYFDIVVGSAEECESQASDLGWDHRMDPDNWDPYGWVLLPENVLVSEPNQVDPSLRAAYADELILSYERALASRSSLEVTFIDKKTRDIYDDTCNGNWPTPTEGAECSYVIFANIPGLRRDYRGFIISFETRSLPWLTFLSSYTYSKSEGSVDYTQDAGTVADYYPWHFDNRYGYLDDHRTHRLKVNGFFNIKGDWTIAFDAFWSSPFTWQPYENFSDNPDIRYGSHFLEPRGHREANSQHQLDLQLSKGLTAGGVRFVLIGTVLNVVSSERPSAVCEHISGCGDIEMGQPTDWQTPRRYELGFRVEF